MTASPLFFLKMENMIRTLERYMETLPKSRYLTLRYWIDTCSQSEQFLVNVCANGFHHLSEGGVIIPQNKPISLADAYSVLADVGDSTVAEFVRTLVAKGGGDEDAAKTLHERYAELNKLRNMKYHKIKPREDASISLDNGRMEFVMGDNLYYDILVDGELYLPKIAESMVLDKILRETTVAGKIKCARRKQRLSEQNKSIFRRMLGL